MNKEETDRKRNKIIILSVEIACVCIFIAAACVFTYPFVRGFLNTRRTTALSHKFDQTITELEDNSDSQVLPEFWNKLQAYNMRLAVEGQGKMKDIFSYESFDVDISQYNFPDNIFGYLEIPALNKTYPIYLGSSRSNMAKGVTVLGETSAPIGGINTNCVIAGHNYWGGVEIFNKIHELIEGDTVTVTNPWGKLTYRVTGYKQIEPYEFNDLVIQKDKDILTLFTCYPNSKSRWCVFCERVQ